MHVVIYPVQCINSAAWHIWTTYPGDVAVAAAVAGDVFLHICITGHVLVASLPIAWQLQPLLCGALVVQCVLNSCKIACSLAQC